MSSSPSGSNQSLHATAQTMIAAERTTRETAVTTLQENITAEAATARAAESANATAISAHTSNTSNPHSVTKAQVGLGNCDNTSDANKPVSTAQAAALMMKAPLDSPALTGTPTAPTATSGTSTTQIATTAFVGTAVSAEATARNTAISTAVSGTANCLAKFTGANVVGSSTITDTGTQIAISGTAPASATFGAELLTGTWTAGSGWSGSNSAGWVHATGNTAALSGSTTFTSGALYRIAWTVASRTAGSITVSAAGISTPGITASGNVQMTATDTTALVVTPTTDFDGTVTLSVTAIVPFASSFSIASSNSANPLEMRLSASTGNLCVGYQTGRSLTSGIYDTLLGYSTGRRLTTGSFNACFGDASGYNLTVGSSNMCIGHASAYFLTSGNGNVCIGYAAGYAGNGSCNVCVGSSAGYSGSGSNCTFIGYNAGYYTSAYRALIIDSYGSRGSASGEASNSLIYGMASDVPSTQTLALNAVTTAYQSRGQVTTVSTDTTIAATATRNLSVTTACTLTLPSSPAAGEEHQILNRGVAITVSGNGKTIYYNSATAVSSISVVATVNVVTLVYDGTYWLAR